MEIVKFITALRETDGYIKYIFMQGGCYQFHLFLSKVYPGLMPYINKRKDHVVSRFDGDWPEVYDIDGAHFFSDDYSPLLKEDYAMVDRWSFSKHNLLKLTECPACDEPITIKAT